MKLNKWEYSCPLTGSSYHLLQTLTILHWQLACILNLRFIPSSISMRLEWPVVVLASGSSAVQTPYRRCLLWNPWSLQRPFSNQHWSFKTPPSIYVLREPRRRKIIVRCRRTWVLRDGEPPVLCVRNSFCHVWTDQQSLNVQTENLGFRSLLSVLILIGPLPAYLAPWRAVSL